MNRAVLAIAIVLATAGVARAQQIGIVGNSGVTYAVSVGGVFAGYSAGSDDQPSGVSGLGQMVDGELGFTAGTRGAALTFFGRFTRIGVSSTTIEDGLLGVRFAYVPHDPFRVAIGAGLLMHHLDDSDSADTEMDYGAFLQAQVSIPVAHKGNVAFEIGADVTVGAYSPPGPTGPDQNQSTASMASLAVWIGVRHSDLD